MTSRVDMLDYMLQRRDTDERWTLGGIDMLPATHPLGEDTPCFTEAKFHRSDFCEVYTYDDRDIRLIFEIWRGGGEAGTGNWIRRFTEIERPRRLAGGLWAPRYPAVGEWRRSAIRVDRWDFDMDTRSYRINTAGSLRRLDQLISVEWARLEPGRSNRSGFPIGRVLRLVSEWHREGSVMELYDYAEGYGLIDWRYLERLSDLEPVDKPGRQVRRPLDAWVSEGRLIEVVSPGGRFTRPVVYLIDSRTLRRQRRLAVMQRVSAWKPGRGPEWYVVLRHTLSEGVLEKREARLPVGYTLPEWTQHPRATLADLSTG